MFKSKAIFEKPSPGFISALGFRAVDMHFHSRYSDSSSKISSIIKLAKKRNVGVAITDHNEIKGSLKAFHNKEGVFVIPGIEVSCYDGPHILFYFYNTDELKEFYSKNILKKKTKSPFMLVRAKTEELLDASKTFNCIASAAHPYGYLLSNKGLQKCIDKEYLSHELLEKIDAIEAICGGIAKRLNRKAAMLAEEKDFAVTAGTDGHLLYDLGKIVCCSEATTVEEFLNNIKKKKTVAIGKEKMRLNMLPEATQIMSKYVRYTWPSLRLQYELNIPRVKRLPQRILKKKIIVKLQEKIKNTKK